LGQYRVRAHIYFADLNKFYYSQTKVFEVTDARPIWQKTVGVPEGESSSGSARTYSLMTNRFPDHTSLYVRVEDKDSGIVYATYSLGQVIAFGEPQIEFDRSNQLHVLYLRRAAQLVLRSRRFKRRASFPRQFCRNQDEAAAGEFGRRRGKNCRRNDGLTSHSSNPRDCSQAFRTTAQRTERLTNAKIFSVDQFGLAGDNAYSLPAPSALNEREKAA